MQGMNASATKFIHALSPGTTMVTAGSTNPSNLAGFEWATLLVSAGSTASKNGVAIEMERSGTSNGTFAKFGASLPGFGTTGCTLVIRSFRLDSSATFYRVSYDNNNSGSTNVGIVLMLSQARVRPITQDTGMPVTVYQDVLDG